jgi:very-short-patch-repair endonuclease
VRRTDKTLLSYAKQMRSEMTPAEACLWYRLRGGRLDGIKFVRQSVRRPYIADFMARSRKLIVEVDGDTHGMSEYYDKVRTEQLEAQGYRILRFTNDDVMRNADGVMQIILEALRSAPLPSAALGGSLPLSASGERGL